VELCLFSQKQHGYGAHSTEVRFSEVPEPQGLHDRLNDYGCSGPACECWPRAGFAIASVSRVSLPACELHKDEDSEYFGVPISDWNPKHYRGSSTMTSDGCCESPNYSQIPSTRGASLERHARLLGVGSTFRLAPLLLTEHGFALPDPKRLLRLDPKLHCHAQSPDCSTQYLRRPPPTDFPIPSQSGRLTAYPEVVARLAACLT
jgi:hypothetical protein